jgi:hypothetical protein
MNNTQKRKAEKIVAKFVADCEEGGQYDVIEIARSYVKSNYANIEYCIRNKIPLMFLGKTQLGKTFIKFALEEISYRNKLHNIGILNTTNLLASFDQTSSRALNFFYNSGRGVKTTNDKNLMLQPRDFVINMTSSSRTDKIIQKIAEAEKLSLAKRLPLPSILVHMDEAEEFSSDIGDPNSGVKSSECDKKLWTLKNSRNKTKTSSIMFANYSATLLSKLLLQPQFSTNNGYLNSKQIFELPVNPYYKGIGTVNNLIDGCFEEEEKRVFNGDSYITKTANHRNTLNPKILCEKVIDLINNDPYGLVQIGNVVMGNKKTSHLHVGKLVQYHFNSLGKACEVWDRGHVTRLDKLAEVVIVIQNGDSSEFTIPNKLKMIADHFDPETLKAILIVSKKMTNKSISIEIADRLWCDPNSKYLGYYCNFTAYYGPKSANCEEEIQYMRCTGNRPDLKRHVFFTTPMVKETIENYYKQQDLLISKIQSMPNSELSKDDVINWLFPRGKRVGKAVVNREINHNRDSSSYTSISNSERLEYLNDGFTERDCLVPITDFQMKSIESKRKNETQREAMYNFLLKKGIEVNATSPDELEVVSLKKYPDMGSVWAPVKFGAGKHTKTICTFVKASRGYSVYVYNKLTSASHIEYDMEVGDDGYIMLNSSRASEQTDVMHLRVA